MLRPLLPTALLLWTVAVVAQTEADYYTLESVTIPERIALEVGGMDFLDDGRLAVCTRRGEVWLIDDINGQQTYSRYARGLHEPLGLTAHDGAIYIAQRGEVTKLEDRNADGKADVFETVYELPLTGNYHEYHYGPMFRPDGTLLTTLNLGWEGRAVSKSKWRGWMLRYDPETDELEPYAAGMRSPAGFGTNAEGDVFVAENQGDWIGSGRITHLEEGDFAGHPAGLAWAGEPGSPIDLVEEDITNDFGTMYAAKEAVPELKLPAVWFPHGILGISTAAIITDNTDGEFGPFAGQMLVSDQGQSKIMRVSLEKVEGEYQGAVFPFREGFSSGLLRLNFAADHALYAGQTARGWAATGGEPFALERLRWTGETPFEMYEIKAHRSGLDIVFTEPVDPASVRPEAFAVENFTYKYHSTYGSPAVDIRDNHVHLATLLPDGKTVRLQLHGYRPGYIYQVTLDGIRGADGTGLLHNLGYYTLNNIPGGGRGNAQGDAVATVAESTKRTGEMPADWNGEIDADIQLETEPGMKFKQTYLTVKAGARVRLTFRNPDDMQHNFLLAEQGKADRVGEAALALGLKGLAMQYVPEMDEVITHTRLVEPETADTIYFTAPTRKGRYTYICTVPGHYQTMRGVLVVE